MIDWREGFEDVSSFLLTSSTRQGLMQTFG